MPSVEIKGLDLRYSSARVLQDLNLEVMKGEFMVLLGSSGCGKSTLLNCIAGLVEPDAGQIHINGRNVTWDEPSARGIGMVFQSYALYPQMSVEKNLSFGLRNAGVDKIEIDRRVRHIAGLLQIEPLLKRKPAALSGGQRQRVAIGRALVRDADVFLFDEPLSNLDAKLRAKLRVEIKRLHLEHGNTMIYVTHDQIEAMTLADRIAILKEGKIVQTGTPDDIYNRPVNRYVADFIGTPSMNFLDGELLGRSFLRGHLELPLADYPFIHGQCADCSAMIGIRPEHIVTGKDLNEATVTTQVVVDMVEPMGADTLVHTRLEGTAFQIRMTGQAQVRKNDRLLIGIDPLRASLFDRESGLRL